MKNKSESATPMGFGACNTCGLCGSQNIKPTASCEGPEIFALGVYMQLIGFQVDGSLCSV